MEKFLYRNETAFGSGIVKAKDIIVYEITELCNTDIIDYCLANYEDALSPELYENLNSLLNDMSDEAEIDEEHIEELVEELLDELSSHFEVEIKYALWLATKEAVLELYNDSIDDEEDNHKPVLTAYRPSKIILSDLGYDGILFGYDKRPMPVNF